MQVERKCVIFISIHCLFVCAYADSALPEGQLKDASDYISWKELYR